MYFNDRAFRNMIKKIYNLFVDSDFCYIYNTKEIRNQQWEFKLIC